MRLHRILGLVVPGAAAAALLLAPVTASADDHGHGHDHSKTVDFSATATSGTESAGTGSTNPSGNGCQFAGVCVVDTSGNANVVTGNYRFAATYTSTLSINYAAATSTHKGADYCAPASGTVQITSTSNPADQIYKSESGQVCGGQGGGAPHTFSGTYTITGGSGRFAGASGSGSVSTTDNGQGTVTSSTESGTITYDGAQGPGPNGGHDD